MNLCHCTCAEQIYTCYKMSTLLSSSCIKMSRASWPQHALLLITWSRERSSFRFVSWSTERKNRAKTNMCSWAGMEKLLSTLAIATSWGVTYLQCKISVPWPLCSPGTDGSKTDGRAKQGLGLWQSGAWRTLTSKHQFRCHKSTSVKSLDKNDRTLDFRVMLTSGAKGKNLHLLIPCFEKISWCLFLSPLLSAWSQVPQVGQTFLRTTLELFFDTSLSGIFCKIRNGHARAPVDETQLRNHGHHQGLLELSCSFSVVCSPGWCRTWRWALQPIFVFKDVPEIQAVFWGWKPSFSLFWSCS